MFGNWVGLRAFAQAVHPSLKRSEGGSGLPVPGPVPAAEHELTHPHHLSFRIISSGRIE